MSKIKWSFFVLLFIALIYTRFLGLAWGLPYPMHPDERNMANAVQGLKCEVGSGKLDIRECFNPHFFAYGQFPLYLGYMVVMILKFFDGDLGYPISFQEAIISLRLILAIASILNVLVLIKIVELLTFKNITRYTLYVTCLLVFTFSPFFIQFSHFGTTESLLMLFYSLIVYLSIKYSSGKLHDFNFLLLTSLVSGIAIATKASSLLFLLVPAILLLNQYEKNILKHFSNLSYLFVLTSVFSIIFSPHNFISFSQFIGSMMYESDVATGTYKAFYTRQFDQTLPIIFQLEKILPYVLGWPVLIFFILGFLFLPFKKEINLLRLAILVGFLSNAFFYAKWTRFIAPIFPLMLVVAVLFIEFSIFNFQFLFKSKFLIFKHLKFNENFKFQISNLLIVLIMLISIIPGVAYLSIYQNPDVRFTVSDWIYKNIPDGSYILSETANVVDAPVPTSKFKNPEKSYEYISFNFYDLDENPQLQIELKNHLNKANFIFIPSRRIFANHYCPKNFQFSIFNFQFLNLEERCRYLRKRYPLLNDYYDKLFSGELGFEKAAEFSSYPKIQLFGKTIVEFDDEEAEETWTVFDHPVFRIYKRMSNK